LLVTSGDESWGIPAKQNFSIIEEALKKAGNENYTLKEIPNLNDMLQTKQLGINSYQIEETISPIALKLVSDWITEQTKIY
jgi:hypothetical protein